MADYPVHISQAEHNEATALKLVFDPPHHDWGIIATFYSAIHYFESFLYYSSEKHSETSAPTQGGKLSMTFHAWREKMVRDKLQKAGYISYRKLRTNSEISRYLSHTTLIPSTLPIPASQYFKPEQAQKMVEKDLKNLKKELRIDLIKFLHELDLDIVLGATSHMVISQIIASFETKEHFLSAQLIELKRFLTQANIDTMKAYIESKGSKVGWK